MTLDKTFSVGEVLNAGDVNGHLLGLWIPIDKIVRASGSAASSVSFSSINSNFRFLRLTASIVSTGTSIGLRLNNDSGNNYYLNQIYASMGSSTPNLDTASAVSMLDLDIGFAAHHVLSCVIAKPLSSSPGAITGTLVSTSGTSNNHVNFTGAWNNTSSLINRVDIVTRNGGANFYGVTALEGMRGN